MNLRKAIILACATSVCLTSCNIDWDALETPEPGKKPFRQTAVEVRYRIDQLADQRQATDSLMFARLAHIEELCDSLLHMSIENSKTDE